MFITPKQNRLPPLLKYPGGKEKELSYILPNLPTNAKNYFEPFVGGGAVYFALDAQKYFINDKSEELIDLYKLIRKLDTDFFEKIDAINHNWEIIEDIVLNHSEDISLLYYQYANNNINKLKLYDEISAFVLHNANEFNGLLSPDFNVGIQNFVNELIKSFKNKIIRMAKLETEKGPLSREDVLLNIEAAFKSAFYMHFRYLYNHSAQLNLSNSFYIAIYFYIREFCYSSMFRYNAKGEFNVPYGGISYNKKHLTKKIEYFNSDEVHSHLLKTQICSLDFFEFLKKYKPELNDFMFLDPPYDSEFNTYAQHKFGKNDQERLADYLKKSCDCSFMLIIKNTEFIFNLYRDSFDKNGNHIKINRFDKKYSVSFQNRNNKNSEHLMITNY